MTGAMDYEGINFDHRAFPPCRESQGGLWSSWFLWSLVSHKREKSHGDRQGETSTETGREVKIIENAQHAQHAQTAQTP